MLRIETCFVPMQVGLTFVAHKKEPCVRVCVALHVCAHVFFVCVCMYVHMCSLCVAVSVCVLLCMCVRTVFP